MEGGIYSALKSLSSTYRISIGINSDRLELFEKISGSSIVRL